MVCRAAAVRLPLVDGGPPDGAVSRLAGVFPSGSRPLSRRRRMPLVKAAKQGLIGGKVLAAERAQPIGLLTSLCFVPAAFSVDVIVLVIAPPGNEVNNN